MFLNRSQLLAWCQYYYGHFQEEELCWKVETHLNGHVWYQTFFRIRGTSERLLKEFDRWIALHLKTIKMLHISYFHWQCLNIANSKSFAKWHTRFNTRPFLGCEHLPFNSDSYWECSIRRHAGSLQHQVCAKTIGPIKSLAATILA